MKATWLGQSGYLFESSGERLLIDPFYSNVVEERQGLKRLVEPPIPIEELKPDVVFITHDHMDHFDPIALPQIHAEYPSAPVIGPQSVMKKGLEHGFAIDALHPSSRVRNTKQSILKYMASPPSTATPLRWVV